MRLLPRVPTYFALSSFIFMLACSIASPSFAEEAAAVASLATDPTSGPAPAPQTPEPEGVEAPAEEPAPNRVGVEVDLVQPFIPTVHIIKPKLTVTLWGTATGLRGDLVIGAFIRPHVPHDILFTIDEYMGVLGYRQYFWRGIHAEVLLDAGAAWGRNRFDGRYYETATLFLDANAGYRFGFFEPGGIVPGDGDAGFYLTPQIGVLGNLGIADIGPRDGKPDWFLQGNLLLGLSFL
jgi:hypothetical protein